MAIGSPILMVIFAPKIIRMVKKTKLNFFFNFLITDHILSIRNILFILNNHPKINIMVDSLSDFPLILTFLNF
jgi:hypothetical protein